LSTVSRVVRIATLVWLAGHFALTMAYLLPPDPLKNSMRGVLESTIGTYFWQSWNLFAPHPRLPDKTILVRPLTQEEVDAIPSRGLPSDGWYDLAGPLHRAFAGNHLTAYERVTRPNEHAVEEFLGGGHPRLEPMRQDCQVNRSACASYEESLKAWRAESDRLFTRIGSAFYQDVARPGDGVTHVAIRGREAQSVQWAERYTGRRVTRDRDIGVFPVDRNVAPLGLYLRPGGQ